MDDTTVNVALRVKPFGENGSRAGDVMTVVQGEQGASLLLKNVKRDDSAESRELFQYNFWRVLEHTSQAEVYESCARPMVASALEGYNSTILAYGQTGAGKTFTMLGPPGGSSILRNDQVKGIIPRAIDQVFFELAHKTDVTWTVKLTYIEIYNETIRDLLNPGHRDISVLDTSMRTEGFVSLKNVDFMVVRSKEQALQCLKKGQINRHVGANGVNDHSSRSHTIFTLWIETLGTDGKSTQSKLNLVDLAGSERLQRMDVPTGQLIREATLINKSLTVLAMVAKELKRKSAHVPYRDSKLTHFLKDSIGGNCKTLVMACIWPDEEHLRETISTCRFADDLQQVEVNAKKTTGAGLESVHGTLLRLDPAAMKYIEMMTAHRVSEEIAHMQEQLREQYQRMGYVTKDIPGTGNNGASKASMIETYQELKALRSQVLEYERQQKEWEARHSKDTREEVEMLKQRVKELEERERQLMTSDGKSTATRTDYSTGVDSDAELELQQLRERVIELEQAQGLNDHEIQNTNEQAKVGNANAILKNIPIDLRMGKMKESDVQDRLYNGPGALQCSFMKVGRIKHKGGVWLPQQEMRNGDLNSGASGASTSSAPMPPETLTSPEASTKRSSVRAPTWASDIDTQLPEDDLETETSAALEKPEYGAAMEKPEFSDAVDKLEYSNGVIASDVQRNRDSAVTTAYTTPLGLERPKKATWHRFLVGRVSKLLPWKCTGPPRVADWEDRLPRDLVIMNSLNHKQVTDVLRLTNALPTTVTTGCPPASSGKELERGPEVEAESVVSDFVSSPLSISSIPIAIDDSPKSRAVRLPQRHSGIPPLDLAFANPHRV